MLSYRICSNCERYEGMDTPSFWLCLEPEDPETLREAIESGIGISTMNDCIIPLTSMNEPPEFCPYKLEHVMATQT